MFVWLDEVGFSHPTFRCRAVRHAEGTVPGSEASLNDVDPRCYDRCEEFQQIIRRAELQVLWDLEAPHNTLIAVATKACGTGV